MDLNLYILYLLIYMRKLILHNFLKQMTFFRLTSQRKNLIILLLIFGLNLIILELIVHINI
jgi:hypothetical protein